ncbi:hypothetical protein [Gaiella sp.]|uniref:hypothetical protein n=1 Tax=Gaiella sp. TaxID=2663207 RepID=UPI002C963682|nr:hypothetical protein [Gaiella sp.]HWO80932.1 hypothetical protein [Gaiella sp.]
MTGISHGADRGELQVGAALDNPLERLRLLSGDDDAISTFLDELDVSSPREREMLAELARRSPLARPERFDADHRRAIEALESLRRHGFHGSRAGGGLGPLRYVVRWLVELVARYLVVSYVKDVAVSLRNLYWLREMEAPSNSTELKLLRPARFDASSLVEIMRSREIGVPSFVIAGLLIPLVATIWRLMTGFTFSDWWVAVLVGLVGVAVGVGLSWVVLRGSAMASNRIRLSTRQPVQAVWDSVGNCGRPPRDGTRKFAAVSIVLMAGVWIVLPALVALALAT